MGERPTGTPCWIDVMASDAPGARAFYTGLLGWTAHDGPPEAGGYVMCTLGGAPAAAIGPPLGDADAPSAWTTYIAVDDADATAARVGAAGGETLVAPLDVLDVGRMAIFRDPAGAVFAVWQKRSHRGIGTDPGTPGALLWNECSSTDLDRAVAFYTAVFGWDARTYGGLPAEVVDGEMNGYRVLHASAAAESGFGGIQRMPEPLSASMPSFWMPYFCSADAAQDAARVVELGGSIAVGPFDVPTVGRIVLASDPGGAAFGLLQPSPREA